MPGLTPPWDLPTDPLGALREGDPAPFEAFVRAAAGRLTAFFRRRGADPEEALDLAQEVFLKLYQNAARYRPEERFTSYCFRVARNVWIDAVRRRSARAQAGPIDSGLAEHVVTPGPGPLERAELREESERLRQALSSLSEHHRLVFELGVVQGLSYAEIGSILAVPVGTVKSRMFYAVRKLREIVEGRTPLAEPPRSGERT